MSHRFALLALALLLAPPAMAEERWYEIELIVFARPGTPQVGEVWPDDPGPLASPSAIRLLPVDPLTAVQLPSSEATPYALAGGDGAPALPPEGLPPATKMAEPFRLVPPERLQLSAEADRLTRAGDQLLFHGAWQQPVDALERTPTVYLGGLEESAPAAGGEDPSMAGENPLFAGLDEHAAAMLREELGLPPLEMPRAPFEGRVQLSVQRYLHLKMELLLRREVFVDVLEAPPTEAAVTMPLDGAVSGDAMPVPVEMVPVTRRELRAYPLRESRRMRSGDLHYLDHPAFGVLALATPVEMPPEPEPEPAPSAAEPAATSTATEPSATEPAAATGAEGPPAQ